MAISFSTLTSIFHRKGISLLYPILLLVGTLCHANQTILVLGDSLSAAYLIAPDKGWVSLLEKKLKEQNPEITVVNSSFIGDTTANGLQRLPKLIKQYQPQIVVLELGGNDGLRGLPVKMIKSNLHNMIKLSLEAGAKVLLVGMKLPPNYGQVYTKQFDNIYPELSNEHQVPLVPFLLEKVALNPKLMLGDKIHPTAQAQPVLLDNVWLHLEPLLVPQ